MERYQIDERRAFQFPVQVSTASKIGLRNVARELLDSAAHKYARPRPAATSRGRIAALNRVD